MTRYQTPRTYMIWDSPLRVSPRDASVETLSANSRYTHVAANVFARDVDVRADVERVEAICALAQQIGDALEPLTVQGHPYYVRRLDDTAALRRMISDYEDAVKAELLAAITPVPETASASPGLPGVSFTEIDGRIAIITPYNADFVADIKASTKSRRWDGARRYWTVSPDERDIVYALASKHFGGA